MKWQCLAILLLTLTSSPAYASSEQLDDQDLYKLSIEELADIPVHAASKQAEPLSAAPTALFVITSDDLLRSNATSLPEALRLAPNLHVERVNATQYAISARGFNGYETSNKLLVLIDGRSIYSTLHSGVFWELHTPMIEDIAQIEVVSGPGGTLFGPNAVNGVISVLSKDASETTGVLVRGTAGTQERTAAARFGVKLGESAALRVSANYLDHEDMPAGIGPVYDDSTHGWQAGFRADFEGDASHVMLQGDIFDHKTFWLPGDGNSGHNLLARWNRTLSEVSSIQIQGYYDFFRTRSLLTIDQLETFDVEAQYNLNTDRHNLVIGSGLRSTHDRFVNNLNTFQLAPPSDRLWIWNGFAQDRFALAPDLSLIAGVKLEASSFSGAQLLPSVRVAWKPDERALFWAAASRAVRTPSRVDRGLSEPFALATAPDFQSEKLIAFEAGYRGQPSTTTSLSVSLYYNIYDDLRSANFIGNPFPLRLMNDVRGKSYGLEAWGTQQILPWWRVSAGGAFLRKDFEVKPGRIDLSNGNVLGRDPGYRLSLRSQMDLPHGFLLDAGLRAVDDLQSATVPGFVEADARLAWRASTGIELFIAGDNLLHKQHFESDDTSRTQRIERNLFLGARLDF